jgi:hypothetical protein
VGIDANHILVTIIVGLVWFMVFNATLQYFSYFVAVSFIDGGNRSTRWKPPTCYKSLTLSTNSPLWLIVHKPIVWRHKVFCQDNQPKLESNNQHGQLKRVRKRQWHFGPGNILSWRFDFSTPVFVGAFGTEVCFSYAILSNVQNRTCMLFGLSAALRTSMYTEHDRSKWSLLWWPCLSR